mmetsp:Transcript_29240/g.66255  ORF Transcript_29240/g.66255 Transcript_29240/m.66255 type:complete len:205 (-) Transcript_29240:10271-10885(-)
MTLSAMPDEPPVHIWTQAAAPGAVMKLLRNGGGLAVVPWRCTADVMMLSRAEAPWRTLMGALLKKFRWNSTLKIARLLNFSVAKGSAESCGEPTPWVRVSTLSLNGACLSMIGIGHEDAGRAAPLSPTPPPRNTLSVTGTRGNVCTPAVAKATPVPHWLLLKLERWIRWRGWVGLDTFSSFHTESFHQRCGRRPHAPGKFLGTS